MVDRGEVFRDIVAQRRSIRAFKPDSVPQILIDQVFGAALRAPSNCNTQPWFAHVVTGEKLESLRRELPQKFIAGEMLLDYPYDGVYEGVYKSRQYAAAQALYSALGIAREQKAERQQWFLRNFTFFDAPACAFFTLPSEFGLREACDLGMFAQTVMLGLTAHGLGSCPQTALGLMANVIRPALELPDSQKLMFGLSFGYVDEVPVNDVVTDRAALSEAIIYHA